MATADDFAAAAAAPVLDDADAVSVSSMNSDEYQRAADNLERREIATIRDAIELEEEEVDGVECERFGTCNISAEEEKVMSHPYLTNPESGEEISKHILIRMLDKGGVTMSTDRKYRVMGVGRHKRGNEASDGNGNVVQRSHLFGLEGGTGEDRHHNGDTFAIMVRAKTRNGNNAPTKTFMLIGEAVHFGIKGSHQLEHWMSHDVDDFILSLNVIDMVSCQTASGDDGFHTSSRALSFMKKIRSVCVEPISPSHEINVSERRSETGEAATYKAFKKKELQKVFELLEERGESHDINAVINPMIVVEVTTQRGAISITGSVEK